MTSTRIAFGSDGPLCPVATLAKIVVTRTKMYGIDLTIPHFGSRAVAPRDPLALHPPLKAAVAFSVKVESDRVISGISVETNDSSILIKKTVNGRVVPKKVRDKG